ncbi:helix-turn-helix transcriptional regulator [Rhizobium sp. Leaf384]|nr:helix-turn-helix transcriptional regulator [Rhizobium sp. Leaf384]
MIEKVIVSARIPLSVVTLAISALPPVRHLLRRLPLVQSLTVACLCALVHFFREWAKVRSTEFPSSDADLDEHRKSLSRIDAAQEPLYVIGRHYRQGVRSPVHSHRKTQLWHARRGVVVVGTIDRRWMIPPGHGLIIPAGLEHASETMSPVEMLSIYVDPQLALVERPKVVNVTTLAVNLMDELVRDTPPLPNPSPNPRLSPHPNPRRRELVMDLLLDEIQHLPEVPLGLPFPNDPRLADVCRAFLETPLAVASIDEWAAKLAMSRRSFTRFFRAQTGVSFVTWRQQACLFASLPRLAAGHSITSVALDAGYENIAAFSTMFRRMMGSAPRQYLLSR